MIQTRSDSFELVSLHRGQLPYIRRWMDLDGPPEAAAQALLARLQTEAPSFQDGLQFLVPRTILKCPSWHAEVMAATLAAPEGDRVRFLDAPSFFLLLKTHLKQQTDLNPQDLPYT